MSYELRCWVNETLIGLILRVNKHKDQGLANRLIAAAQLYARRPFNISDKLESEYTAEERAYPHAG